MKAHSAPPPKACYLPDLCSPQTALSVVLIIELTAIVLALARTSGTVSFWTDLARTSTFLLWIGLIGASLLCSVRGHFARASVPEGCALTLLLVCGVVAAVSEAALLAGHTALVQAAGATALFPREGGTFLLRNVLIALIVTLLALRYFYVWYEWRRNVEMQAQARVHALQARIRPHFLFNSMNTIAALTRSDPACAEQAVQDLADLFRVSLSERRNTITLQEELDIARTYQRIEQLRLGERLAVCWNVAGLPMQALVPSLTLQPLLENAIYHGIEPRAEGGAITITGDLSGDLITLVVRNAATELEAIREGNRLALANIRERLTLMYGDRALVKAGRFDSEYVVTLRFPHVESPGEARPLTVRVLIVDDEQPARDRLRTLLAEIGSVEIAGEAATGEQALQSVAQSAPSVVLLDVRMPGMDGMETAHRLSALADPPAVIFTTAYDEYAVSAFDAQAVGYLLKPVRKEKLAAALQRAARLTQAQLGGLNRAGPDRRTRIPARHRDGTRLIPIEEVLYFFADRKYTTVRHVNGEDLIEDSLRALEEEFADLFVRIHRNALVSTRCLDAIERNAQGQYFVRLRGCAEPLQVSRRMASELRERYDFRVRHAGEDA